MAKTEAAPQTSQAPPQIQLSVNDVLGMLQRLLADISNYCWSDPRVIHPAIIMDALERAAHITQQLPVPAESTNGKDRKAS